DQRGQFALLGLSILLVLLVNMLMLRRRFSPLDRLIERVEAIDPADPADFQAPHYDEGAAEVDRLAASFHRMLRRIDEERKRSGRLVVRAQEEERRRLARDLHDEVNQSLTAILLRLEAVSQTAPPELKRELADVKKLVNQAMGELVTPARQLRPPALELRRGRPERDGRARPASRRKAQGRVRARARNLPDPSGALMLRILLADDHGIVRSGLRMLIDRHEGMNVVAEAEDGVTAVDA